MPEKLEEDTLRQAATAAKSLIRVLEAERKNIDEKIRSLSTVINAADVYFGQSPEITPITKIESIELPHPGSKVKKRKPRGETEWHINEVLENSQGYDEHALRKIINEKYSKDYQRSTINTVLNRLKGTKYKKEGSNWKLIDQPEDTSIKKNGDLENEELKSPLAVN